MCPTPALPSLNNLTCQGIILLAPAGDSMFDQDRLAEIASVAGGPVHDPGDPDSQVQHAERFES